MELRLSLTVLTLVLGLLSGPSHALAGSKFVVEGTDENFQERVVKSKVPVLVDFWAPWCGPCRYYGPMVERAAELHKGKLRVVKVNVDENQGLSRQFSIRGIPMTLFYKDGKVVKTFSGAPRREKDFQAMVAEFLKPSPTALPAGE